MTRFAAPSYAIISTALFCVLSVIPSQTQAEDVSVRMEASSGVAVSETEAIYQIKLRAQQQQLKAATAQSLHVIVDTSASQTGDFRQQSLELAEALSQKGSITLWSADVTTQQAESVAALKQRVPAGTTNLKLALETVTAQAEQGSAILYLGDGICATNLLSVENIQQLCAAMQQKQIALHAYAVGPNLDLQLLGTFVNATGGTLLVDRPNLEASSAAAQLTDASRMPVQTVQVTAADAPVYPQGPICVRSDRDSYLMVKSARGQELSLVVNGQAVAVAGVEVSSEAAYLNSLWSTCEATQGVVFPLAGEEMIASAKLGYEQQMQAMVNAAEQAELQGSHAMAVQTAQAVLEIEQNNVRAQRVLNRLQNPVIKTVSMVAQAEEATPAPNNNEVLNDLEATRTDAPNEKEQNLVDQYKNRSLIQGQRLRLEVMQTLEDARQFAELDPQQAITDLKQVLGAVRSAQDVDPEIRAELERRVGDAILQINARKEQIENVRIRQEQKLAEIDARRKLISKFEEEEQRLEQLVDRVRSLVDDGRRGDLPAFNEAEAVARAAVALRPGNGPATAALFGAEAAGQLSDAFQLRSLRADRFLEVLTQVELSHVPFPDEPPVRYPPAEVWKNLTEQRRKWKSVNLRNNSPTEDRILAELDKQTEFKFPGTPLDEARQIIAELHNIPILMDPIVEQDNPGTSDEPIDLIIAGITLRSALKLMLEPLDLTWVIEDEVMKFTTIDEATTALEPRVYAVGDLVVPLNVGAGAGGGLGGIGGQGGQGGFGGGQGGGGFGGGGFGGGGGQGGGFFSVPAPQPEELKKKR